MSVSEQIIERMIADTDGKGAFVRRNRAMSAQISNIRPYACYQVASTLIDKCLIKVPKLTNEENALDDSQEDLEYGRWSYPLSAEDIVQEIFPPAYAREQAHNINKSIRILIKRRMFYRFIVKVDHISS